MSDRADAVHAEITAAFIAALEAGIADITKWTPPWAAGPNVMKPYNPVSGHHFSGGNRMICAIHSWVHGLGRQWATYDQWASLSRHTPECLQSREFEANRFAKPVLLECERRGCELVNVRRGERSICTLLRPLKRKEINEQGMEVESIYGWTPFKVFNASQVNGFEPESLDVMTIIDTDVDVAFDFARLVGATVEETVHDGASFIPAIDKIQMPARNRWTDPARCFSTMAHELTHWTGHPNRLKREPQVSICNGIAYSKEDYAREELVAELGAAFLCAAFDRTATTRDDHTHYLGHWLSILKEDPKALWNASGKAQTATTYITRLYDMATTPADEMFTVVAELVVDTDLYVEVDSL